MWNVKPWSFSQFLLGDYSSIENMEWAFKKEIPAIPFKRWNIEEYYILVEEKVICSEIKTEDKSLVLLIEKSASNPLEFKSLKFFL